jgi:UDP-N-acetylglucosamine 4-epimerase
MSKTNPYYEAVKKQLLRKPKTWLVTGCAGFIGSNLVENLLKLNQKVVGLDNFATGRRKNLSSVRNLVGTTAWKRFQFIRGDITKLSDCYKSLGLRPQVTHNRPQNNGKRTVKKSRIDIILHQAGLGSVPRSIANPLATHATNVTGTLNLLVAARDAGVKRFVYAASSSTYGDSPHLPKKEKTIGEALSPYAVSKHADELYAGVFGKCYGLETVGLRYFNVFGPRQDPAGAYAAVIPRWIGEIMVRKQNVIYGDGQTSRDFCYVDNVVQANLLAGTAKKKPALNKVYNVACGQATSLALLHMGICAAIRKLHKSVRIRPAVHRPFRAGDVRHSLASIAKARLLLGYQPLDLIREGIEKTVQSYFR